MAVEKFETALKKLEEVVRRLEGGELSLDDSLKAFEEGVKLAGFCSKKLNEAEAFRHMQSGAHFGKVVIAI